jgi:translation initiation factor 3 subunit M
LYSQGQVDEQGLAAAKDAAMGAIRDPVTLFHQQRGMLTMPAIQALSSKTETKRLYGLLTIFQEEKLEDYHAFVKENGLSDELSSEDCIRHMRILSLCSLAAEHEEIPYTTVAQTLQLPSDKEVESWVIAAVSSGLLAAKMDQLQQKVMVERAVVRRFDMEQWKALQSRLNVWKQNVRDILEGLKQTQAAVAM